MDMLINMIADSGEDAEIGVAGMVDEARGTSHVFAIDFVWRPRKAIVIALWVGEFVEGEEIDVFALRDTRIFSASVSFVGGYDLADVAVDELSLSDHNT